MSDINVPPQLLAVSLMFSIMTAAVQHTTQCITLQNVEWQCNFSISSLGFRIVMTTINNHFRAYSKSVQRERKSAFVWRCLYHADFVLIGTFLFEKNEKMTRSLSNHDSFFTLSNHPYCLTNSVSILSNEVICKCQNSTTCCTTNISAHVQSLHWLELFFLNILVSLSQQWIFVSLT